MGRRIKAQTSTEFLLFIGVIFLVVLTVISSLIFYMRQYTKDKELVVLQKQAQTIKNEIYLAAIVENGYSRTFQLKSPVDQVFFNLTQKNNSILFMSRYQQHVAELGVKINGTLIIGNNTIRKIGDVVYVN